MYSIARLLSLPRFIFILFILFFVIVGIIARVNIASIDVLRARFEVALQPIIAFSVSLVIFPFISVPAVESIISRAERAGIKVSSKLVEDYIHGCYTVFLLAISEIVLIITYSFLERSLLILLAVPILITLIILTLVLVYSLWKVTLLLQRVLA